MAEFTPINTQAEFDAAIADRLKRSEEKYKQRLADHDDLANKVREYKNQIGELTRSMEEASKKLKGHQDEVAGLQAQIKNYESRSVKTRIAHEVGIPYELADRLAGDTEDDIRRDAEAMKPYLSGRSQAAPLASSEPSPKKGGSGAGTQEAAMMALAQSLGRR